MLVIGGERLFSHAGGLLGHVVCMVHVVMGGVVWWVV